MQKNLFFLFITLALFISNSNAKDAAYIEQLQDQVDEYIYDQNYEKAIPLLLELDSIDNNNLDNKFLLIQSFYNSNLRRKEGIPYAKEYISLSQDVDPDVYFYLGQMYHLNYEFEAAKNAYNKFLESSKKNHRWRAETRREIEALDEAKKKTENPEKFVIRDIGSGINHKRDPDYVPVISADESVLIFTSRRPGSTGGLQNNRGEPDSINGEYFEDIYISQKINDTAWSEPVSIGPNINTNGHDASIGLSPDGQKLFLYRSDGIKYGNIYTSDLKGDEWQVPEPLPYPINTRYWEGSASITPDGRTIYFASNRPGGYGGKDLYMIKKLPDDTWAQPKNLGPEVNTSTDEDAPFIHPDGTTLYFSSKGHKSIGGHDIFVTQSTGRYEWSEPKNMGYPVNTTANDIYFVLSASGERGYYSSVNDEGIQSEDIKVVEMPRDEFYAPQPLTVLKGFILPQDSSGETPPSLKIEVYDNETGDKVGDFQPNELTGRYILILPRGKDYNIAVEADGYLFHSENVNVPEAQADFVEINKNIYLQEIKKGSKIVLNNIFFDFNEATLRDASLIELERVIKIMKDDPKLVMEFLGHTDAMGDFNYNTSLSQERADVAVEYLVSQGISKDRLLAIGYGETRPVQLNAFLNGRDNSAGRQLNRRTELEIIGVDGENAQEIGISRPKLVDGTVAQPINSMVKDSSKTYHSVYIGTTNIDAEIPSEFFAGMENVLADTIEGNKLEYYTGWFEKAEQATVYQKELISRGIENTRIVAFQGKERVAVTNEQ